VQANSAALLVLLSIGSEVPMTSQAMLKIEISETKKRCH
jgi:hypothetical protein